MEVCMHMINQTSLKTIAPNKHKPIFSKNPKPIISCQTSIQTPSKTTNFYQVLSLSSQNAGFDEIKKAYKTMALQYHPDVCSDVKNKEEYTKRFIELRRAYETLSDPNSRRVYDCELMAGLEDPFESHYGSCKISRPDREVWERQLNGLRKRSVERMKRRRSYDT